MADVLSITRSVAATYAHLRHRLAASGRPIPVNDLWIAATAHATNAVLFTTDRDFLPLDPAFLRLIVIDPATT